MTFSEYALGLMAYVSYGKSESEYFTELVGNFIEDAAMESCILLDRKADTQYRYVRGTRAFSPKSAQYLYDHRDKEKFSEWIWERMDESDSYDGVTAWLASHGVDNTDPTSACADLLESILLNIIKNRQNAQTGPGLEADFRLIDEIREKIKALPHPPEVPVPEIAAENEQRYIDALLLAYGDAEKMSVFTKDDLASFCEYAEDLEDRRVDFYAAEGIRLGVRELGDGILAGQFDVLKEETLSGVKDTARRPHENGYVRMLAVMEQAAILPITDYLLSASPYWINEKIRKGVCHHLVNDGKLAWVRRKKSNG